ncbi:MAG: glycosyltransferase 87 family protein [Planctomycetota bacterium]|nr:glycosyltransferase 87 family protein [Planctomycetota bacterium]
MSPRLAQSRRAFVAAWILLAAFLVLRTAGRDRGVITDHIEFGRRLLAGLPLYAPYLDDHPLHPVYPPSFGLLTGPFSWLPERGARIAWGLLQVAALGGVGAFLASMLRRTRPALVAARPLVTHTAFALTMVLGARYVLRDTHGGGGNTINLAFALAAFAAAERGRSGLAAAALGFSLATKPTTAFLLPVLLGLGHTRAALGAGFAAALFAVASLLVQGFEQGLADWGRWFEGALAYAGQTDLFAQPHLELPPFTWMNQSLRCAVARFLGTAPDAYAELVPGYVQGVGFAPETTTLVARTLGVALAAATLLLARRMRATLAGRVQALALGLTAGVLLSPISWKAHHTALLPAFHALAVASLLGSRGAQALGAGYFVLCVAGGGDLVGTAVKEWQQSLYLATFGALALWGWLGRSPSDERGAEDPSAV